jgi:hypothetical protein
LATLSVVSGVTIVLLALAGGLAPSLLPGTLVGRDARWVAAAAIFAASYLALAVGRVPGLAIDRAGVALVGACLMVAGGALPVVRLNRRFCRALSRSRASGGLSWPASRRKSAVTRRCRYRRGPQGLAVPHRARAQRQYVSAPPGSLFTSPIAARSSTRRKWRRMRARARLSSTTGRRSDLRKTKWRGFGCERILCCRPPR